MDRIPIAEGISAGPERDDPGFQKSPDAAAYPACYYVSLFSKTAVSSCVNYIHLQGSSGASDVITSISSARLNHTDQELALKSAVPDLHNRITVHISNPESTQVFLLLSSWMTNAVLIISYILILSSKTKMVSLSHSYRIIVTV